LRVNRLNDFGIESKLTQAYKISRGLFRPRMHIIFIIPPLVKFCMSVGKIGRGFVTGRMIRSAVPLDSPVGRVAGRPLTLAR